MENDTLVLMDENGEKIEFEYLDSLEYNGKEYIVLLPLDNEDAEEVVILEAAESEEGSEEYIPVLDNKVLDAVFEEFKKRMKDEFDFTEEN